MLGTALINDGRVGVTEHHVLLTVSGIAGRLSVSLARQDGSGVDYIVDLEGASCEIAHGIVRIVGFQSTPQMLYRRMQIAFSPETGTGGGRNE